MIRVILFGPNDDVTHIEFDLVPMTRQDGYRSSPPQAVPPRLAKQIAEELACGFIKGWVEGYRWYLQAGSDRLQAKQ